MKHSDVGYGHFDTCEANKPPLDTSNDKIVQDAIGWSKSRTTNDVVQLYSEYVNCIYFPADLNKVFPELQIIRLYKSNVKFIENTDLRNLPKLKILDLDYNNIEVLQSDLFMFNSNLKEIHLQHNKLKFISAGVFSRLSLIVLKLEGNLCVSENAINDITAMLSLKLKVDETCSAPEFLLVKNTQLIKNLVDLNFTLTDVTQKKTQLEVNLIKTNSSLATCEDEKETIENERFRMNSQIRKDANMLKKLNGELAAVKELNNELIAENVRLTSEVRKLGATVSDAEEKIYDLITNNRVCSGSREDSFKEVTLKYENEKLSKEISELKAYKEEIEREWRTINLNCHFVSWSGIYTCQNDKLKVKVDDSEVVAGGKHLTRKSAYDVKKLFIRSKDAKTLFLPVNFGAVFPQIQSIVIENSNLISIKIECFDNMPELKEINLNNNAIEDVPYDAFTYPVKLEKLSLAFNRIKILNKDTFKHLKKLKALFLNDNKIEKIHTDLFKANEKIELLTLRNNNIKHIGQKAFESLKKLSLVNFENNKCITGSYSYETLKQAAGDISSKCSAPETQDVLCKFEETELYTCNLLDIRIESDNVVIASIDGEHLPAKSDDKVKQLKAVNQNIKHLPAGFSKFYKNIEKFSVKNSALVAVSENDFKGLTKVKELFLASNKISFLDIKSFNDLVNLEVLNLSNNLITEMHENILNKLAMLKVLDISANKIQKLSQSLLSKNDKLETINASGNRLSFIGAALLNNKRNLKIVNFIANTCINDQMPDTPLNTLKLKILEQCQ